MDRGVNSATEAVEDATGGVRMRYPNVTIDQSQVRYEQNLRLKASRSAAKGIITRRRNGAREMMSDFGSPYDIEQKLVELDEAITDFEAADQAYHNQLDRGWKRNNRISLIHYSIQFFPSYSLFLIQFCSIFIIHFQVRRVTLVTSTMQFD